MEKELAYADLCTDAIRNLEGRLPETLRAMERLIAR